MDHDRDPGMFQRIFLSLWDIAMCRNFADDSRDCLQIVVKSIEGGVSRWNKPFDFVAVPDHDPNSGIFERNIYTAE